MLHNFPSRVKSLDGAAEFRARTIHSSNGKFAQLSAWHLTAVTCDGKAVPKFRHRQVVEALNGFVNGKAGRSRQLPSVASSKGRGCCG